MIKLALIQWYEWKRPLSFTIIIILVDWARSSIDLLLKEVISNLMVEVCAGFWMLFLAPGKILIPRIVGLIDFNKLWLPTQLHLGKVHGDILV